MKTPEEIKKGLDCCGKTNCDGCPYDFDCETPYEACARDALAYVQQLESQLTQAERERDAAVAEWKRTKMDSESMCCTCKHGLIVNSSRCRCVSPFPCDEGEEWQWRGVCPENTKEGSPS